MSRNHSSNPPIANASTSWRRWSTAVLVAACAVGIVRAQELDCSFQGDPLLLMDDLLSVHHIVNENAGTITFEITYDAEGWVGFGVQPNGKMIGGEAIIVKPNLALSSTNPGKYIMSSEEESGVVLMSAQTLSDASFEQVNGQTILRYTKLLSESNEIAIDPDNSNTFIFAAGGSNTFEDHGNLYGRTTLDSLNKCRVVESSVTTTPAPVAATTTSAPVAAPAPTEDDKENEGNEGGENESENEDGEGDNSNTSQTDSNGDVAQVDNQGASIVGGLDCSFRNEVSLMNGKMALRQIVNPDEQTMTVELTYSALGWVAFGVSKNGKMIGGEVIIAKPDEAPSSTNPGKYFMTSEEESGISLMDAQTLTNASFVQSNGQTILRYTKPLQESGEIELLPDGSNTFIYAAGSGNTFADHGSLRGRITLTSLTKCQSVAGATAPTDDGAASSAESSAQENTTRKLWVFHGILMGISWAIFLPLGIGCSVLRRLIPGTSLWFKLHMFFNGSAFVLMTAAFGAAVYNVQQDEDTHFEPGHEAIGLGIYLVSFVQVLAGIFRPHLPKPASTGKNADTPTEEDGFQDGEDTDPKGAAAPLPPKSVARRVFEVGHRTAGFTLLGLAWYNCYTGIVYMAKDYGDSYDKTGAFWGVVGGIGCTILVLYAYQQIFRRE